ncbi:MAG: ABC transporter permease subunit [Nitrospinota bacterium]
MRNVLAIYKKELRLYFHSPIAYVVLSIFLILTGWLFYSNLAFFSRISVQAVQNPRLSSQLSATGSVLTPLFGNMSIILLFIIPALTMRLFAEEKKQGTIELLYTYPVRDGEVLFGKYLACVTVFLLMLVLTALYPGLIAFLSSLELGPVLSGYLGTFLLGVTFISLGVLMSALTHNQLVAFILAFGALLFFWVLGFASAYLNPKLGTALAHASMIEHINNFSRGLISTRDVVYYLNFSVFCLFLTIQALASHRWRG